MKIDTSKLKNVVNKPDGEIVSQCPACAAAGHDKTGEHLIVYPEGRFGCVAHPKEKDHKKKILDLVGMDQTSTRIHGQITVRSFKAPASKTLLQVSSRSLAELGLKRSDNEKAEVKI